MHLRDLLKNNSSKRDEFELFFGSLIILILGMIIVWLQ
jgi:hypothetical protein